MPATMYFHPNADGSPLIGKQVLKLADPSLVNNTGLASRLLTDVAAPIHGELLVGGYWANAAIAFASARAVVFCGSLSTVCTR
jgi:hypothetical protein